MVFQDSKHISGATNPPTTRITEWDFSEASCEIFPSHILVVMNLVGGGEPLIHFTTPDRFSSSLRIDVAHCAILVKLSSGPDEISMKCKQKIWNLDLPKHTQTQTHRWEILTLEITIFLRQDLIKTTTIKVAKFLARAMVCRSQRIVFSHH